MMGPSGRLRFAAAVALLASAGASAQDAAQGPGFDAHGFVVVPQDGDPRDPFTVSRAGRFHAGEFWMSGLFEYADAPLLRLEHYPYENHDDVVQEVVGSLLALNLSAGAAVHDNIRLDLTAPVFLMSSGMGEAYGAGLGDVRLGATVALARPQPGWAGGFGLAVVPFLDLPTGDPSRFLGKEGVAGGAKVAGTYEAGPLTVTADLGAMFNPSVELGNITGSDTVLGGLALGYLLADRIGVVAEAHVSPPFSPALTDNPAVDPGLVAGTASPSEALLGLRGMTNQGFHWAVGGAKGLSGGAGAANYRAFVQLGFGRVFGSDGDRDFDRIADVEDACPDDPETYNLYKDEDGCPDAGGRVFVEAYIGDRIEEYVEISVKGGDVLEQFETTLPDAASVGLPAGTYQLVGTAPGFRAAQELVIEQGRVDVRLDLEPVTPANLRISVVDGDGRPVPGAGLSIIGDGAPDSGTRVDDAGQLELQIPPGDFVIFVKAPELGVYRKDITLTSGQDREIRAVLGEARAEILTDRIQLYESVYFETNQTTILSSSYPLLDEVAGLLVSNPDILEVEIQGHTDSQASDDYNLELSQGRAEAVREYLRDRGVQAGRLTAMGYGEAMPIADNATAEGRALNRRVEFVITRRVDR